MSEAVLIRHPPVLGAAGLCYGRSEMALVPGWEPLLPALVAACTPVAPVLVRSSPSRRCLLLAGRLAKALRCPLHQDARLLELDFGEWEGVPWDVVPRAALDAWAADPLGFTPPGGESGAALITRLSEVARAMRADGSGCVVVSHGGPLRVLPALLSGQPPDLMAAAPAMASWQRVRLD